MQKYTKYIHKVSQCITVQQDISGD